MELKNFVEELRWRGMIHDVMPDTEAHLMDGDQKPFIGIEVRFKNGRKHFYKNTDNVTLSQRGRFSKRTLHDYEYNSNSTLGGTYSDAYALIFRANQLLYYVQNFEGESKNNVIAEAKALRALAHFNLVTFFGQIPTQRRFNC